MKICKAVLTLVLTIANLAFAFAASADTVGARCQTGVSPVGAWQRGKSTDWPGSLSAFTGTPPYNEMKSESKVEKRADSKGAKPSDSKGEKKSESRANKKAESKPEYKQQ
ncbi:MAG: hypothetical protein SFV17_02915 [Candidatus Obscuribacter sp.]|nr:hypothetical protein [Candidatus Obscuribacter sp.]